MAPSPTIRRLLKETAELSSPSSNPNPAFFAAPVSDADLHEWHFTLLGPPAPSPYAGGIYHGRITLPTAYPLKPPNFRFLTPSGRFEVNREICLSISGFHEETWMPAWGVRTALTALRSFMVEKGSTDQVGGMEASAEVRARMARESRAWKCAACKKSNEAIMREWWDTCRNAGLDVHEEDLGLEVLPEGLELEARDPNAQTRSAPKASGQSTPKTNGDVVEAGSNGSNNEKTTPQQGPQIQQPSPIPLSSLPADSLRPNTPLRQSQHSGSLRPPSQTSLPFVATPSAEAVQESAEAVLTPSDLALPPPSSSSDASPPRARHPLMSGIHASPITATNAAAVARTAQPLILQRDREREKTITIDRAIAGVFLALCLMVLKKIFYPAGGTGYGGGVDEFYLQRE